MLDAVPIILILLLPNAAETARKCVSVLSLPPSLLPSVCIQYPSPYLFLYPTLSDSVIPLWSNDVRVTARSGLCVAYYMMYTVIVYEREGIVCGWMSQVG